MEFIGWLMDEGGWLIDRTDTDRSGGEGKHSTFDIQRSMLKELQKTGGKIYCHR